MIFLSFQGRRAIPSPRLFMPENGLFSAFSGAIAAGGGGTGGLFGKAPFPGFSGIGSRAGKIFNSRIAGLDKRYQLLIMLRLLTGAANGNPNAKRSRANPICQRKRRRAEAAANPS